jgi:hydroxymethylpyrimidine/phosphomethylpyrimidine kinase
VTSQSPLVLTIAGFDPSGGAGIIADVRTIVQFGCRAAAAMTSLTFQNAAGFYGATHETAQSLRAQVVPVIAQESPAAVKIGMLPTPELAAEVASLVREHRLPAPIIDPVLQSSSGFELIETAAIEVMLRELLPLAGLVTPNIPEAEILTGVSISNDDDVRTAATRLREMGAAAVLIKGGHATWESRGKPSDQTEAVDLLDYDDAVSVFRSDWIQGASVRGTGCMLSAAIAASMANGADLVSAVEAAKKYVASEIQNSKLKT